MKLFKKKKKNVILMIMRHQFWAFLSYHRCLFHWEESMFLFCLAAFLFIILCVSLKQYVYLYALIVILLFYKLPNFNEPEKDAFWTHCVLRKNDGYQLFFLLAQCFITEKLWAMLKLSSAHDFHLVRAKFVSSRKGLQLVCFGIMFIQNL